MNNDRVIKEANDLVEIKKIREKVRSKKFQIYPEEESERKRIWKDVKRINIIILISIIPNSFVLSYFSALRKVLSEIFEKSPNIEEIKINVLFMEDIVILEESAHKEDFISHYEKIVSECATKEEIRRSLVELKRSEFASIFNMVLHSFDDSAIKEAFRKGKIKTHFNNLTEYRKDLEGEEGEGYEYKKISTLNHETDDATRKKLEEFENNTGLTGVQSKLFFKGEDQATILELGRVLYPWINDNGKKIALIVAKTVEVAIAKCFSDLWNKIKNTTIWFSDPEFQEGKMPIYLNLLSRYVNKNSGRTYMELEEFYHNGVLENLRSTLFEYHLTGIPNKFGKENYDEEEESYGDNLDDLLKRLEEDLNKNRIDVLKNTMKSIKEYNILYLRSYQMGVINKGFLTIQDQMLQQLSLIV